MKMKNIWTDQKWMLLKKWPTDDTCHHADPKKASTTPLITTQNSAAMVTTPKTYTHEPMYAGCLVGSNSVIGSVFSTRRRTDGCPAGFIVGDGRQPPPVRLVARWARPRHSSPGSFGR